MRSNITRELFKESLDQAPKDRKKMFNIKRGITMVPEGSPEKKITSRHKRSLSNDRLAGESEADINY
tara:strand:+ start:1185 stop:1385 length:201 start_codon:yes stop_codon:yes gene_type:complete